MLRSVLLYSAQVLVLLRLLQNLFSRTKLDKRSNYVCGAYGLLVFALVSIVFDFPRDVLGRENTDFYIVFWKAGRWLHTGSDPYQGALLNPPTIFPMLAVIGSFSLQTGLFVWSIVQVVCHPLLIFLANHLLVRTGDSRFPGLRADILTLIAATFSLSFSTRLGISSGQVAMLASAALYFALLQRSSRHSWASGLWLAVATVKVGTMMPFLIFFVRRSYWKVWGVLGMACLFLMLSFCPIRLLPERLDACLHNISAWSKTGGENDFSYANERNIEMVSLDMAIFRAGVHDRRMVRVLQFGILVGLGLPICWIALRGRAENTLLLTSQVCLYSSLFLYHRFYDLVILAFPLVHASSSVLRTHGWSRRANLGVLVSILGALYVQLGLIRKVIPIASAGTDSWRLLLGTFVATYPVWLLLTAIALMYWGSRESLRDQEESQRTDR